MNADVVIDLITFKAESTYQMVEALKGTNLSHYLFCASIWAHGHATIVPAPEDLPRHPLEDYGINKAKVKPIFMSNTEKTVFRKRL